MQEMIVNYFLNFPKEWAVFLLSMIPITELRASIPVGVIRFGMDPFAVFFYAVLGNTLLGALVFLIAEPITRMIIQKVDFLHRLWQRYIDRIHKKNKNKFEKWGAIILVIFVAIPLPMTGAFSGAVAATIFEIPFKKAVPLLMLGCAIAGVIVLSLTILGAKAVQ